MLNYAGIPDLADFTGIPTSTLYAYRSGKISPSSLRNRTLYNAWRRMSYNVARTEGLPSVTAKKMQGRSAEFIDKAADTMMDTAQLIAQERGLDVEDVLNGMLMSDKDPDEWAQSPILVLMGVEL